MALFFVNPPPLHAVELIEDLIKDGITVQQWRDCNSIAIRPYPEQIPMLERICQKHLTELQDGLPPQLTQAMIKGGAEATVLLLKEQAATLRKEWRDRAAIAYLEGR